MPRRFVTGALAIALASAAASARAQTPAGFSAADRAATAPAVPSAESSKKAESGEKLKEDFSRLIADARAGKTGLTTRPRQQPPAQSNSLSKKTKITIAVVVAAVVITAVVIAAKANDGPGGSISIF